MKADSVLTSTIHMIITMKLFQSHHLGAELPEAFSKVIVKGLRVFQLLDLAVREVFSTHTLHHLLTDCTVDGGLGSLPR